MLCMYAVKKSPKKTRDKAKLEYRKIYKIHSFISVINYQCQVNLVHIFRGLSGHLCKPPLNLVKTVDCRLLLSSVIVLHRSQLFKKGGNFSSKGVCLSDPKRLKKNST